MRYPIPCPKGKYIFHRADQLAVCNCKFPTSKCRRLKRKVNDLLAVYVGGSHVLIRLDNPHRSDYPGSIFGMENS